MNEGAVLSFLGTNITKERINQLSASAAGLFPGAGPIAAIMGALVMRAVAAAKKYRDDIDTMPIVPPDLPLQLTYNEAVQFFKANGLTGMFSKILGPAADLNNTDIQSARVLASKAATAIKKCFDRDDALFNTVYAADIAQVGHQAAGTGADLLKKGLPHFLRGQRINHDVAREVNLLRRHTLLLQML